MQHEEHAADGPDARRRHPLPIPRLHHRQAAAEGCDHRHRLRAGPQRIIHSWVEVDFDGRWVNLEGFILDAPYLASLQRRFPDRRRFCGYGAATPDLSAPAVEWRGQDTYIQRDGIADDFGVFDSPDEFYARHGSNLSGLKRWLYSHVIRHRMNAQVRRIRAEKW